VKTCPSEPELNGSSGGCVTPVGQVEVVAREGHEDPVGALVSFIAPDMPFEGVVDGNETGSVCGCALNTEVLVRRGRVDCP